MPALTHGPDQVDRRRRLDGDRVGRVRAHRRHRGRRAGRPRRRWRRGDGRHGRQVRRGLRRGGGFSSSESQSASSSCGVTVRETWSNIHRASRSRPPARNRRVSIHGPSSARQLSQTSWLDVDPACGQPLLDPRAERRRRGVRAPPAQGDAAGQLGDVGPLGQHGSLVAADPVHRPAATGGDLLGGGAGADLGLHLTRPQLAGHLDLQLAEVGPVAADGRAQRLVHGQQVLLAAGSGEQQVLAVLVDADQAQVMHARAPPLCLAATLPPRGRRHPEGAPERGALRGRPHGVVRPSTRAQPRPVRRGPAAELRRPGTARDVLPFLENVTRGRGIPRERLLDVAEHYYAVGGKSPINDQNRALLRAAGRARLPRAEPPGDVGQPQLGAVHRRRAARAARRWSPAGRRRHDQRVLVVLLVPPVPRGPGRRRADPGREGRRIAVDRIRAYYDHPGFVAPGHRGRPPGDRRAARPSPGGCAPRLRHPLHPGGDGRGLRTGRQRVRARSTARSPPRSPTGCGGDRAPAWDLVYCSRSGPPGQPWLEPDVNDHLRSLHAADEVAVVLVPIGFVSDHMEVVHDLDTEAAATASRAGPADGPGGDGRHQPSLRQRPGRPARGTSRPRPRRHPASRWSGRSAPGPASASPGAAPTCGRSCRPPAVRTGSPRRSAEPAR